MHNSLASAMPIIKPINGLCNLACKYCYMPEGLNETLMSDNILESIIKFFSRELSQVEFVWHGGEPLLAEVSFFKKIVDIQKSIPNKFFINVVQTNGTLVNDMWGKFFSDNKFVVGVSLDGTKDIHNENRHYPDMKGSFDQTMYGIDILKQYDVFSGIICGVNKSNFLYPEKVFNFFIENDIKSVKFSRIKDIGCCKNIDDIIISPLQYYDFLIKIFDIWLELDDPSINIRNIEVILSLLFGGDERDCSNIGQCGRYVTVNSNGHIYACDSFPESSDLYFGHVNNTEIDNLGMNNLIKFNSKLEERKNYCKSCEWFFACRGGCSKDFYKNMSSIESETDICTGQKKYFCHIRDTINGF